MIVKLLYEHHKKFLSIKGGSTGLSDSTLVKMQHCLKSHVTAYLYYLRLKYTFEPICNVEVIVAG